ncbi:hypothetical protein COCC4DRAFT_61897 [Bipolaris maydis ATCC 48331]|uniref:Uncharacterized protein n=1 Tax=Cochliobolus heterostrophus (strain C4 / ATCC 48331 / race T) TaxID=665024 RepID=N4XBH2_COCH4|nr:uncharacterized protein COCC4DRAFT_61897 [Bipolaris maydis ATCC 48331]ENI03881.1 hypothetical protein COCC4DRAFT_61897 [Bipolaris maydis ATCC 48331]
MAYACDDTRCAHDEASEAMKRSRVDVVRGRSPSVGLPVVRERFLRGYDGKGMHW